MDKYPFYFEVTHQDDGNGNEEEGGFLVATDYADATAQIIALYEPGLISIKLECMDEFALVFKRDKAREIKSYVEENNVSA